jgi:DNA processing protein
MNHENVLMCMCLRGFGRSNTKRLIAKGVTDDELFESISKFGHRYTRSDVEAAREKATRIKDWCQKNGVGITTCVDSDFPKMLHTFRNGSIRDDAPVLLYYKGDIKICDMPGVAIIGTRRCTRSGYSDGVYIATAFAKNGYNVISGLAKGCDTSAHAGAILADGKTTALLSFGLGNVPDEFSMMAKNVVDSGGLLITEYEPDTPIDFKTLVERDRLQAGLADITVLIQSNIKRGGSMHAVRVAQDNLRDVYAYDYRHTPFEYEDMCQQNIVLLNNGEAKPITRSSVNDIIKKIASEKK